jgi:hypothetical protein
MHTLDDIMGIAPAADDTNGALPAEVLAGKTYWSLRTNSAWGTQTGTMTNNGAVTYTPGTNDQPVAAGYHNGSGIVAGDAALVPGNIIRDVSIFGVTGTYPLAAVALTWQTKCYTTTSSYETTCPVVVYYGQDGDHQKGVVWPKPRFTANVDNNGDGDCEDPGETCDGTVTDNLTGLIWLKNADCFGDRTWADALSVANGLSAGQCGLTDGSSASDWRLPNVRELHSLIDYGWFWPPLPNTDGTDHWSEGDPFTGVELLGYWSSTSYRVLTSEAWLVGLYDGAVLTSAKSDDYPVWPVRGGQ